MIPKKALLAPIA